MAMHQFGLNDVVLMISLFYSCVDLQYEWELFETCKQPIHKWLLVSYAFIVSSRFIHLIGTNCSLATARAEGRTSDVTVDFLLDMRQKGIVPRVLAGFSWAVALPFFMCWTLIGTIWLVDVIQSSPTCVPSVTHLWFSSFWLLLCYVWICTHVALGVVAFVLERRVRRAERNLSAIEDDDIRSRWGEVSRLSGFSSLSEGSEDAGLSPAEINELPGLCEGGGDISCCECAICICELQRGDSLRRLPRCGHTFHRACIDLWLLRRADCPLCKCSVRAHASCV